MSDRIGANRASLRTPSPASGWCRVGTVPRSCRRAQDDAEGRLQEPRGPTMPWPMRFAPLGWCSRRCSWSSLPCIHSAEPTTGCSAARHSRARGVVRRSQLSDPDCPPRCRAAGRVRIRRNHDHRRHARGLVVRRQISRCLEHFHAGSQMISYELVMGLTVLGLIVIYGTLDLGAIARQQSGMLFGFLPASRKCLSAVCALYVPHRGHRGEQADPVRPARSRVGADRRLLHRIQRHEDGPLSCSRRFDRDRDHRRRAVHQPLFLGGYDLPFMDRCGARAPRRHARVALPHGWLVVVLQLGTFLAKVLLVCSFQILVRWSLPRFRYDQLLRFAWKIVSSSRLPTWW